MSNERSTGADTADDNLGDNSSMARLPLTSMQRYALMQRLEGKPGAEAAAIAGVVQTGDLQTRGSGKEADE